ncbi:hypothetical protein AAVH_25072, partial [Aphelenchoides avenae]
GPSYLWCNVCRVYNDGKEAIEQHLQSDDHKEEVDRLVGCNLYNDLTSTEDPHLFRCTLCDIAVIADDDFTVLTHLLGKPHMNKWVRKSEADSAEEGPEQQLEQSEV